MSGRCFNLNAADDLKEYALRCMRSGRQCQSVRVPGVGWYDACDGSMFVARVCHTMSPSRERANLKVFGGWTIPEKRRCRLDSGMRLVERKHATASISASLCSGYPKVTECGGAAVQLLI